MPIYKRCSRCGKRIPAGAQCLCINKRHQEYDRHSRNRKSKRFYGSKEWEDARTMALELDNGIDVFLFMTRGEITLADTVHHIIPITEDPLLRSDPDNLMSLSHESHSHIEQMYKKNKKETQEYLRKLLREYRGGKRGGAV